MNIKQYAKKYDIPLKEIRDWCEKHGYDYERMLLIKDINRRRWVISRIRGDSPLVPSARS